MASAVNRWLGAPLSCQHYTIAVCKENNTLLNAVTVIVAMSPTIWLAHSNDACHVQCCHQL